MKWDEQMGGGIGGVFSSTLQEMQHGTLGFFAVIFPPPLSLLLVISSWWISGASAFLCVTPLLSNIWKWFILHFTHAHPLTSVMMQPGECGAQAITWRIDILWSCQKVNAWHWAEMLSMCYLCQVSHCKTYSEKGRAFLLWMNLLCAKQWVDVWCESMVTRQPLLNTSE